MQYRKYYLSYNIYLFNTIYYIIVDIQYAIIYGILYYLILYYNIYRLTDSIASVLGLLEVGNDKDEIGGLDIGKFDAVDGILPLFILDTGEPGVEPCNDEVVEVVVVVATFPYELFVGDSGGVRFILFDDDDVGDIDRSCDDLCPIFELVIPVRDVFAVEIFCFIDPFGDVSGCWDWIVFPVGIVFVLIVFDEDNDDADATEVDDVIVLAVGVDIGFSDGEGMFVGGIFEVEVIC